MKTYTILNIVSIILLITAFSLFFFANSSYYYSSDRFRVYYEEQEKKGMSGDEIWEKWQHRGDKIDDIANFALKFSIIISSILSIISVYLKPNLFGIILLVILGICILGWIFIANYRYSI